MNLDGQSIFKRIANIFLNELKENKELLFKIIGISLLCSILNHLQNHFESNVSEIAFYVCYMLVIILIVTSFSNIVAISTKSISKLKNFMNMIIPILITLLLTMGNIATAASIQPVVLVMISIISTVLSNLIIPIIMASTVLNIVSNISKEIKLESIGKFFNKSMMYLIEFMMIIFVGILSLEGTLSAGVDGMTAKVAKTVVSNSVPIVGKLLGDATESVIGSISITKNAVGVIGILIIVAITSGPIIKSFLLMMMFNFTSGICDSIADNRISRCLSIAADSIKLVFGIMIMVTFLFIIAITLMIKMSNLSLIYK
ncbi:MAG: stage III sporulation protein AE [Clostridia bacterium]|nr:stage III sporulation protein AE [Clostridia bacterium]